MTDPKPRYTVGTITTNDQERARRMLTVYAKSNLTHEEIYFKGIEQVERDLGLVVQA